jgi:hypothetical protein
MTGRVLRCCTFVATSALLAASLGTTPLAKGGIRKSLFVSALDQAGKPVTGLTAQDVLIREDNVDRQVVEVKPASQPISVAVLVDTAQGKRVTDAYGTAEEYVRDLRVSVNAFTAELMANSKDASVLLGEFGQAAMTVTPFTQSPQEIDKGVKRLVSRPDVGSVLFEALVRANGDLAKQPTARRAIVSLNLEPSDEQSREDPNKVRNSFAASGAQLWAVSVQRGGLKNSKRDLVLNDLAKYTGGQRDFVVGISAVENIMRGYAAALASQFEVVYERPENAKGVKLVLVGTARPDVKLHASVFAPQ